MPVDIIKVKTNASAKSKSKGKKSKSKAKASASVVVRIGRDGRSKKSSSKQQPKQQPTSNKQQPIIINNVVAPPPLSDTILARQNQFAPMHMGDNQPFVPAAVSIPSNIPVATPVGQPYQTHRQNTLNNSISQLESDFRDWRTEAMSEYGPERAQTISSQVRNAMDAYLNNIQNQPTPQLPSNLFGNNALEDVVDRMSQMSTSQPTQPAPTASMGGDSSSSSGNDGLPPPPPQPLQLPAPNPADAGVVEEPVTSIQDSNSVGSSMGVSQEQLLPVPPLPQLQLIGNYQPLLLQNGQGTPSASSHASIDTPDSTYNPLFGDFEVQVVPAPTASVAPTQVVNPQGSVGTTQVVSPGSGDTEVQVNDSDEEPDITSRITRMRFR